MCAWFTHTQNLSRFCELVTDPDRLKDMSAPAIVAGALML
jgi:hypothetical protein